MPRISTLFQLSLFFLFAFAASLKLSAAVQPGQRQASSPQSTKEFNEQKVAEVSRQIAGKEDQPAEVVFTNIKIFKGIPSGRLLKIMQLGFSDSLGVNCAHCHTPGQWEKEDKQTKQIAREMSKMAQTINNELLRKIDGLKGPNPIVNCTTCHRGEVKPALNLPSPDVK